MNINKSKDTYFTLTIASILAVFSLFFLASVPIAHAERYGYDRGYNNEMPHNDNYGVGYGGHNYHYIAPRYNYQQPDHNQYQYTAPTTIYVPTYTYVQPTPNYVYEQPTYQYQQYPTYSYNTVASSYPSTYVQTNSNAGGLNITCSSDPSTAFVNQPVTWTSQVTNGLAPYTYSWTGSDGLTGTQSSVLKYYSNLGQKSAVVTITSSDGLTGTITCGNSLTVISATNTNLNTSTNNTNTTSTNTQNQINPNSATVFGSIGCISFGIFAILIILILIGTIFYIVLSRSKI